MNPMHTHCPAPTALVAVTLTVVNIISLALLIPLLSAKLKYLAVKYHCKNIKES